VRTLLDDPATPAEHFEAALLSVGWEIDDVVSVLDRNRPKVRQPLPKSS
jgi:hypothetical protein